MAKEIPSGAIDCGYSVKMGSSNRACPPKSVEKVKKNRKALTHSYRVYPFSGPLSTLELW